MNKSISSIVCLLVLVAACNSSVEARPKRSIYVAAAAPIAVASIPVVQTTSHVVHSNPTSVVKTESVRSGNHASYSYSSEVQNQPIVQTHTHTAAAAPVVAAAPVAPAVAAVPHAYYATHHYGYYPHAYSYYSPYSYVIGK